MKKDTDTITAKRKEAAILTYLTGDREVLEQAVYELIENHQYTSEMISRWLIWMFC